MLFKPHTVTLLPPVQGRDEATKTVYVPTYTPGDTIACQITPEKATVAFEAVGVQVKNPHTLLCDVADGLKLPIGLRLEWTAPSGKTRKFVVKGPLQTFEMGTEADCGMVILEELTKLESKTS